jgi:hypothetical protein
VRARFPWKAVVVGGVALSVVGAAVLARGRPLDKPRRVALIGDSYAVGLGPELEKLLPDFKYEGRTGTRTGQWASHAAACGECGDWLTSFKPDLVLVALGVNDGASPNPSNYHAIVQALHGIGARVIWIEPPAAVAAPAVRDAIAALGVGVVPATPTPLAADGLHPISYGGWAREIAQAVARG